MLEKLMNDVILDVCARLPCGGAFLDFSKEEHLSVLEEVLREQGHSETTINEIAKDLFEKSSETNQLSPNDVSLLKNLGLRMESTAYAKLKLEDVDVESVSFNTGGGTRVFEDPNLKFRKLYAYIRSQPVVHITTAASVNKLRSADNIRICQWGPSRGPGSSNYEQIIAIFKLVKQFSNTIKISDKAPQGINYEMRRVEEINSVLSKSATPQRLYLFKDKKVVLMHAGISSASKITGVGKADIALENDLKKEVFWISYKHGDYFGKQGQVLLSVPFQQYGSLQGLYDIGHSDRPLQNENDIPGKEIQRLINTFIKVVMAKSKLNRFSITDAVRVDAKGKNVLIYSDNGKVVTITPTHPLYDLTADPVILKKLYKYVRKEGKLNLHFFVQGTPEYYFDMTEESKLMDQQTLSTIAGKSIYGAEFFVGNDRFSRENINMLLQSSRALNIQQHKAGDDVDGIILQTDAQGHILINPNLPSTVTDALEKVIDVYLPVLFVRFTRNEHFKWMDETGKNMMFGGRFLILPKGKMPSKSIKVEL